MQDSFAALGKAQTFQKVTATTSDAAYMTASANANADLGSYKIQINQLAQNHALATNKTYASPSEVVGSGSLTVKFGTTTYNTDGSYKDFTLNQDKAALSLTIDSSNNTLTGVRDAINKANAGVNASIVYNGSGYQLVINSTDSGVKNSLQIVTQDDDGSNTDNLGLSALAFNNSAANLKQNQAAQDAQITINGLGVTSSKNTIGDALKGITLNLQQAQAGKTISLDVNQSAADVGTAITGFVGKYNDLLKIVSTSASYNSQDKTAGALLGESAVLSTMSRLRSEISKTVTGLSGSVRTLADVGISTQKDGTLTFDSSKLDKAYATDRSSVAALFSVMGRPSDSSILYMGSGTSTKAGSYAVNITQAATQGSLSGSTIAGGAFTIDSTNNTLELKVNGMSSGIIQLSQGSYASGAALAAELQTRINGDDSLKIGGASVKVSYTNSQFVIQSSQYGSSSAVAITKAGTGTLASLGLAVGTGTSGQDIAGTIGGVAARGQGQLLTAISGDASGLGLFFDDSRTGDRGSVNFSRGIMEEFGNILKSAVGSDGLVTVRTTGITANLTSINKQRTDLATRMSAYQAQLLAKFNAMDALMGQMQATSTYLTQNITAMNNASKSN